jgi:hypothetical protein
MQQFTREMAARISEAQALRAQLARQGGDSARAIVRTLDSTIANMEALQNRRIAGEPRGIAELQNSVVEGLKSVEFGIRRQFLSSQADKVFLGNKDEVPAAYQKMVEEYYKALSKTRVGGAPPPPPPGKSIPPPPR